MIQKIAVYLSEELKASLLNLAEGTSQNLSAYCRDVLHQKVLEEEERDLEINETVVPTREAKYQDK